MLSYFSPTNIIADGRWYYYLFIFTKKYWYADLNEFFFCTGCLSVPLFNQRKRSRLPMTSNPSENEFSSTVEFNESDFADSSFSSGRLILQRKLGLLLC